MTRGIDLVEQARQYRGVRWVHQGRSVDGLDCLGLVQVSASALGLTDFDTRDYSPQATDEAMFEHCSAHLVAVRSLALAQAGDLPVMRFGPHARHIGILADYPGGGFSLIHAFSRAPHKVVEHLFNDAWLRSYGASLMGVFRFPGVTA